MKTKLKGSTILESLIAMIVLVICLGISGMIYANVLGSDKGMLRLKTTSILENQAIEIKKQKRFIDDEIPVENMRLSTRFSNYEQTDLIQMHLVLKDNEGRIVAEREELINKDE
jgi:Tfp pilus assembly protein PilV